MKETTSRKRFACGHPTGKYCLGASYKSCFGRRDCRELVQKLREGAATSLSLPPAVLLLYFFMFMAVFDIISIALHWMCEPIAGRLPTTAYMVGLVAEAKQDQSVMIR